MFRWRKQKQRPETQAQGNDPEQDIMIARAALEQGDLAHGLSHLGGALMSDPTRPDWLALLDAYIARAGKNPLALVPLQDGEPTYEGVVAVRAYMCASLGYLPTAITLLLPILLAHPNSAFIDWLLSWQERPGFANAFSPEFVNTLGSRVMQAILGSNVSSPSDRATLERVLPVFALATRLHPDALFVWFMYSAALRKLGRYDEAYAAALEGHSLAPGWQTAVALALVCRARGDTEEALARYREAGAYQPIDVSARNDIGDILFDDGRLSEAAAAYGEALAIKPDEPWALPSYLYCMHRLHPGDGWDARLRQLASDAGDNARAQALLRSLSAALDAYVTALPPASEACVNLARELVAQVRQGKVQGGAVNVSMNYPESPSAVLAVRAEVARVDAAVTIALTIEGFPTPDPRYPLRPVDDLLWSYDGGEALPALPAPPPEISRAIAAIAARPFDIVAWREPARALARSLTVQAIDHLLAVMVYPPDAPAGIAWWDWLRLVQLAAASVIARLDDGWGTSVRRRALVSLAYGPIDWSGCAAVVALADLAMDDEEIERDVTAVFLDLFKHAPDAGAWALEMPLLCGLARLPHLDDETRAAVRERLT